MNAYAGVAARAVELVGSRVSDSAPDAWKAAAREAFPHSTTGQDKSCPRGTFLGLCEEGWVKGVPPGKYTRSHKNKAYGIRAAALIATHPELGDATPRVLWERVLARHSKEHNSQMDAVLGLHQHGLLALK